MPACVGVPIMGGGAPAGTPPMALESKPAGAGGGTAEAGGGAAALEPIRKA